MKKLFTPDMVDMDRVDSMVRAIEDITNGEWNYDILVALSIVLAELIRETDVADKAKLLEAILNPLKTYVERT